MCSQRAVSGIQSPSVGASMGGHQWGHRWSLGPPWRHQWGAISGTIGGGATVGARGLQCAPVQTVTSARADRRQPRRE